MDILICGSAAAEGIPALFCSCETCQRARERGGKDLRTRTAYQFGEAVRVDFGPDALAHSLRFNLRYERLLHLFITHSHEDHLYPLDFQYRQPGFSVVPEGDLLTLYGNAAAMAAVSGKIDANPKRFRLALVELRPFVEQAAGNTGLSIHAVAGQPCPNRGVLHLPGAGGGRQNAADRQRHRHLPGGHMEIFGGVPDRRGHH